MATERIVTLTPTAVERDSRSFKQAASIARLGYRSVVVEGEASGGLDRGRLSFELISPPVAGDGGAAAAGAPGGLRGLAARAGRLPGWFRWRRRLNRATAERLPTAVLYWLHSPGQFPALARAGAGSPIVYDAHDFYPALEDRARLSPSERAIRALELRAEHRCVRRSARVVTVSDGVAALLAAEFQVEPVVIRNCHDPRLDRSSGPGLRARLGLGASDFLVVMVGNAKPGRAIGEAIAALSQLPESVHLAFLGNGYQSHRDAIASQGLERRVHLPGPVAPDALVPHIASADAAAILYYPLTVDYLHALPNGFFTSVAAGLPLLYPAALPEVATLSRRFELGLPIEPRDPSSIAAALRSLVADRPLRARLAAGAGRGAKELVWEREEARIAQLVEGVLR